MTSAEYVAYQLGVAEQYRQAILDDPHAPRVLLEAAADADAWGSLYLAGLEEAGQLRSEDLPPEVHLLPPISSLMSIVTAGLLGIDTGGEIIAEGKLVEFFRAGTPGGTETTRTPISPRTPCLRLRISIWGCPTKPITRPSGSRPAPGSRRTRPRWRTRTCRYFFGLTGERSDAVAMKGPTGYGMYNFVPVDTRLPYTITFENPATADAAVNQIRIQQELDDDLDVRSFVLGDIFLGDIQIHIPDNRASFSGDFDFVGRTGIRAAGHGRHRRGQRHRPVVLYRAGSGNRGRHFESGSGSAETQHGPGPGGQCLLYGQTVARIHRRRHPHHRHRDPGRRPGDL